LLRWTWVANGTSRHFAATHDFERDLIGKRLMDADLSDGIFGISDL
jgi:hypothetical protein